MVDVLNFPAYPKMQARQARDARRIARDEVARRPLLLSDEQPEPEQAVINCDTTMSPYDLLEHFLDLAKGGHLVFLGVHAVRRDGVLIQAASGLAQPDIEQPQGPA